MIPYQGVVPKMKQLTNLYVPTTIVSNQTHSCATQMINYFLGTCHDHSWSPTNMLEKMSGIGTYDVRTLRRFSHYSPSKQHRPGKGCLFQDGVLDLLVSHELWKIHHTIQFGKSSNSLGHFHMFNCPNYPMVNVNKKRTGTSPCYEFMGSHPLFRLGHVQVRKLLVCLPEGIR